MKRLTEKHYKVSDGHYMKCSEYCQIGEKTCAECDELDKIVDRFGEIEDILGDDYDLDRLRELLEADRDGRCVVLPCKVGDTVYSVLPLCGVNSHRIQKFERNSEGDFASSALMFPFSEFGKTVFRDKEAAEAALERMKSDG